LPEIHLRLGDEDLRSVDRYAEQSRLDRSEAVRGLIRLGLRRSTTTVPGVSPVLKELALHNLVGTEQVLLLLESFVRRGPGAAAEVVHRAAENAYARLLAGEPALDDRA
jgi:hypothetical protein